MFSRIEPDHSYRKVAAAIRAAVSCGDLLPGDLLPSQRLLQEQFGVSKVTVLEALRLLEANGVLGVQAGRNGGAMVLDSVRHSLARPIAMLLEMDQVDLREVGEMRRPIEVESARLATERATAAQIRALDALLVRLEAKALAPAAPAGAAEAGGAAADAVPGGGYTELDLEFHAMLAEAAGNRLLRALMDALSAHVLHRRANVGRADQARLNASLRALLDEGIKQRDPEAAGRAMAAHLSESDRLLAADPVVGTAATRERGRGRPLG